MDNYSDGGDEGVRLQVAKVVLLLPLGEHKLFLIHLFILLILSLTKSSPEAGAASGSISGKRCTHSLSTGVSTPYLISIIVVKALIWFEVAQRLMLCCERLYA